MDLNLINKIFIDINETFNFLIENNIVKESKICSNCNGITKFRIFTSHGTKKILYKCSTKGCQKRETLHHVNIPLNKYIHIIYLLMTNCTYEQLYIWYNLSSETIFKIKKEL
ncbi:hypothetical protein DMUE_0940 [Dictyocoela muelleri]|nr:hypothetical protein DMUE_0940 [Dictyocoela muelleri]